MGAFTSGMGNPGGPYQARPDLGPGVGFGVGLPGAEFQEGLPQDQQNMIGNQTDMFTQSMQQPTYQPTQGTQQNPSVSIGFGMPPGGGFGGGKGLNQLAQNAMQSPQITQDQRNAIGNQTNQFVQSIAGPGLNPSVSMGMPIQQPNRFIPPNAPGGSARRPQPGVPFPGQTGMTRPRTAPQPMPINRFTRGRFR